MDYANCIHTSSYSKREIYSMNKSNYILITRVISSIVIISFMESQCRNHSDDDRHGIICLCMCVCQVQDMHLMYTSTDGEN